MKLRIAKVKRVEPKSQKLPTSIPSVYKEENDKDLAILNSLMASTRIRDKMHEDKKEKEKKKKEKPSKKKKSGKKRQSAISALYEMSGTNKDIFGEGGGGTPVPATKADKSAEDFYEQRFDGSIMMLRDLLKNINHMTEDGQAFLDMLKKTPHYRGYLTAITNQTSNLASLVNTKLSIVKEITSVNKSISDLELKRAAREAKEGNAAGGAGASDEFLINQAFAQLMDTDTPTVTTKKKKKKKKLEEDPNYNFGIPEDEIALEDLGEEDFDDMIDARFDQLVEAEDIVLTDNEQAFHYEGDTGIKIVIRKWLPSERWEFEAVNALGEVLDDHPLPDRDSVGRIQFDKDKGIARDRLGTVYEVMYSR